MPAVILGVRPLGTRFGRDRRDAVAAHLHVHAQTVRYRMGQLREAYGDRLDDPGAVLDLLVALHPDAAAAVSTDPGAEGTNP